MLHRWDLSTPRNSPLRYPSRGERARRASSPEMRRAHPTSAESAQAMRNRGPRIAVSAAERPARDADTRDPGPQVHDPRRARRRRGVINVLRHDLRRRARHANITTVEREATRSRCDARGRMTAQGRTGRAAAVDPLSAFIDSRLERPYASRLHHQARCTSVPVIVYSGAGATRGKGSGGVGTTDADDGRKR